MRCIRLTLLFFGLVLYSNHIIAQRQKIDSLLIVLSKLNDTARIDCLDEICRQYVLLNLNKETGNRNPDSALHYAELAFAEAQMQKYYRGIAMALQRKGWIERIFFANYEKAEVYSKEAILWYEKTPNKDGLCYTYVETGNVTFSQSKYDEALEFLNKAVECFKAKNDAAMLWPLSLTGQVYREMGEYDKAFDIFRQCLQIAKNTQNNSRITQELFNIGHLYSTIESYENALTYYQQALARIRLDQRDIFNITNYAEVFSRLHQYDSALYYYNSIDTLKAGARDTRDIAFYLLSMGEYYLIRKEYDKALNCFLRGLAYNQQFKDNNQVKRALIDLGKIYLVKLDNSKAIKYARDGLRLALQTKSRQYIRDAYQLLYSVYNKIGKPDSAFSYYRKYIAMKEEVLSDQIKGKFAAYHYEQKLELLDKEKQLQKQQLLQATQQKKILIIGSGALLLIGLILLRNIILKRKNEKERFEHELQIQKLESDKTRVELEQQATELEMQALRAQMNPHFIFNSLNSINRFILQNNRTLASEYLTKFSRLVRLILQNSKESLITLEKELEALQLYLELESLRFEKHFDFKISVANDLDISSLKVPPLIIQPYVENAIWHGLMHKEEKGQLDIEIFDRESLLFCRITDDGIGRQKAEELNSKSTTKHKSMGLKITAERIAMLHQSNGNGSAVTINDLANTDGSATGTEVIIKIPALYD